MTSAALECDEPLRSRLMDRRRRSNPFRRPSTPGSPSIPVGPPHRLAGNAGADRGRGVAGLPRLRRPVRPRTGGALPVPPVRPAHPPGRARRRPVRPPPRPARDVRGPGCLCRDPAGARPRRRRESRPRCSGSWSCSASRGPSITRPVRPSCRTWRRRELFPRPWRSTRRSGRSRRSSGRRSVASWSSSASRSPTRFPGVAHRRRPAGDRVAWRRPRRDVEGASHCRDAPLRHHFVRSRPDRARLNFARPVRRLVRRRDGAAADLRRRDPRRRIGRARRDAGRPCRWSGAARGVPWHDSTTRQASGTLDVRRRARRSGSAPLSSASRPSFVLSLVALSSMGAGDMVSVYIVTCWSSSRRRTRSADG